MLEHDSIYFPEVEDVPEFAMAFTRLMFAHAEFEEQIRHLQTCLFRRKTGDHLGTARNRLKRMAKLIKGRLKDHPGLVENHEASRIKQILKDAIDPCDRRNLLAHGRWWRFQVKTLTLQIRGERKGEPKWADYTVQDILWVAEKLETLAIDLERIRRAIEHRRGDHDVPENDIAD